MKVFSENFVFGDGDVAENENKTGGCPHFQQSRKNPTKERKKSPPNLNVNVKLS